MFTIDQPFKYLLTYKYSQDHIELLFSCIRAKGGWNNNPNCLQLKYATRKMLLRNAVNHFKECKLPNFLTLFNNHYTIFHSRKHKAPLKEAPSDDCHQPDETSHEENLLLSHFNASITSEFLSNVLFYIGGFIVSKLVKEISCSSCNNCLLSLFFTDP